MSVPTSMTALVGGHDTTLAPRPVDVPSPGGASSDSFMVHIPLHKGTEDGDGATWPEHVTDEQYNAR